MYDENYDKILEVIHYITNKIQGLTRTQIIKLVYLIDREFYKKHDKQMTNAHYYMYFYGPYCYEYEDALNKLRSESLIREKEVGMSYKIYFNKEIEYTLNHDEKEFIDNILKFADDKKLLDSAKNIKNYIYTLEEVTNAEPDCELTFKNNSSYS